jgi:hypothetical protein
MRLIAAFIFYPMLWMRGLLLPLLYLASSLAFAAAALAAVLSIFGRHSFWPGTAIFAAASFLSFVLGQLYDSILFRLNPTGRTLILYQ